MPICPPDKFVASGTLKYGRWDNTVCPGPGVNKSTPVIFEIFNFPTGCLQGVGNCNLGNLTQNFGDPIPSVAKHVSFTIYCFYMNLRIMRKTLLVGDKLDLQ